MLHSRCCSSVCNIFNSQFEINTPSLNYLKMADRQDCFKFVEDMPNLVEAHVEVDHSETEKLLRFLTSVERLSMRLFSSMVTLNSNIYFSRNIVFLFLFSLEMVTLLLLVCRFCVLLIESSAGFFILNYIFPTNFSGI